MRELAGILQADSAVLKFVKYIIYIKVSIIFIAFKAMKNVA